MRVPIACGLAWPERIESGASRLDFAALAALTFEEADVRRFPGLHLSWQALNAPEGTTAVLNAANEVAVDAFLTGKLRFDHIHAVNLATLDAVQPSSRIRWSPCWRWMPPLVWQRNVRPGSGALTDCFFRSVSC